MTTNKDASLIVVTTEVGGEEQTQTVEYVERVQNR